MGDLQQWLLVGIALVVPAITVFGFGMKLSSRLTKAEIIASDAKDDARDAKDQAAALSTDAKNVAKEANEKAALLSVSFSLYREQIAREYIHREVMREVEDRLTAAIERLGDRLDRVLEHTGTGLRK